MMELVSIIIPVYNSEKYLSETIDSILDQTYERLEIICINDGSTDHSLELLEDYVKKDGRILVITTTNGGVSRARNIGIKKAQGDYICFIDSDDIVEPIFIERLLSNAINNNADISSANIRYFGLKNEKNVGRKIRKLYSSKQLTHLFDLDLYGGYLCNKMYKSSLLVDGNQQLLLNTNIYMQEDLLYNYLIMQKKPNVYYDGTISYKYRINSNSVCQSDFSSRRLSVLDVYRIIENNETFSDLDRRAFYFHYQNTVLSLLNQYRNNKLAKTILKPTDKHCIKKYLLSFDLNIRHWAIIIVKRLVCIMKGALR